MSHSAVISAREAANEARRKARAKADQVYKKAQEQFQTACGEIGHVWKWHQVAGEGRYCDICGIINYEGD